MRPVTITAIALLIPALALAQQPTTPPPTPAPTPAPVVVPPPTAMPAPVDTAKAAAPAPAPVVAPAVTPAPAAAAAQEQVATISPGMSVAEVEASWGKAGVTRTDGDQTFLFYKNDCLKRCGTFDVVILEGGKVVDAIVRASYHRYDGTSSSPAGTTPHFTRPPR
ncbi:MAG TPA: hypothetical protein VLC11_02820 [Gemmatimonadales bacterium]|nr:hypothetical protein [Gemmatimonadales bacterium]